MKIKLIAFFVLLFPVLSIAEDRVNNLGYSEYRKIVNEEFKAKQINYYQLPKSIIRKEKEGLYKFNDDFFVGLKFDDKDNITTVLSTLFINDGKRIETDLSPLVILASSVQGKPINDDVSRQLLEILSQAIKMSKKDKERVDLYFTYQKRNYGVSFEYNDPVVVIYSKTK
ncbi:MULTISPECIES: hypothetical protein [Pasteurellaceae]|uniref:Transmembrane protein n=1 Tax=Pasteurella atlantica TaxID=2827233 RepID=A0AAW8CPS5_9PAST|nr:hypothetical protein [Pasteurella atlantica]MBR0573668.1 hypothetical protein [Pasteurella atlantica]MDP8039423.1 hypothetical protein [Pasteurella atlantica]MDP8041515.1 hypothetical protein [Pasteurella atlantica]MDP8043560.1 hypothetical protein [Pasteurella atlantica]MDP8045736.1 hypothetical protein [Pasteurella atlantica]